MHSPGRRFSLLELLLNMALVLVVTGVLGGAFIDGVIAERGEAPLGGWGEALCAGIPVGVVALFFVGLCVVEISSLRDLVGLLAFPLGVAVVGAGACAALDRPTGALGGVIGGGIVLLPILLRAGIDGARSLRAGRPPGAGQDSDG